MTIYKRTRTLDEVGVDRASTDKLRVDQLPDRCFDCGTPENAVGPLNVHGQCKHCAGTCVEGFGDCDVCALIVVEQ